MKLRCAGCGETFNPPAVRCGQCDGLLRSEYSERAFRPGDAGNIFAFRDWLPVREPIETTVGPVVYRSERLSERLRLGDLAIAFNGYAPEIGARNPTGSFKDFEALPTLLYYREHGIDALVLASAGNTARAFAHAASRLNYLTLIVVPEDALRRLWLPCPPSDAVRLIVVEGGDYTEAIEAAGWIAEALGIVPEGGARNVARRDGMAVTLLEYARRFGRLPDHYVQAIGSGTGAIAVWEGAQRLLNAGIGEALPMLHLAQNAPFAPIHDAWTRGKPIDPDANLAEQLRQIAEIEAPVLANRAPPYSVPGGVRDALASSRGFTYAVTNAEARIAGALFGEAEGISVEPAAAVAVAALIQALRLGRMTRADRVLLHVTGNSDDILRRGVQLCGIEPVARLRPDGMREATARRLRSKIGR